MYRHIYIYILFQRDEHEQAQILANRAAPQVNLDEKGASSSEKCCCVFYCLL